VVVVQVSLRRLASVDVAQASEIWAASTYRQASSLNDSSSTWSLIHSYSPLLFLPACLLSALARCTLVRFLSATAAALFSTAGFFVHSGPRATLSFFLRDASVFVTFFDLFSLAFCLSVYFDLSPLGILPASLHDRPFCK
jgi:hypothetical protein